MSGEEPTRAGVGDIRGLLARIQAGDEDAARELLARYEAQVRLVVRRQLPRILRSRFDSLDFLQSVWGSFFQRVRTAPTDFQDERNLVAFLAWAARNKVIDTYRHAASQKQNVHRDVPLWSEDGEPRELPAATETPSAVAQAHETFDRLRALLPEDRRAVLEWKARGFSSREIGDRLGLSERTVQRLLEDLRSRAEIGDD